MSPDRVLVPLSDLDHAWFFRAGVTEALALEARTMHCRLDDRAQLPPNVSRALLGGAPPRR